MKLKSGRMKTVVLSALLAALLVITSAVTVSAADSGTNTVKLPFTEDVNVNWNWNDLLKNPTTSNENVELAVAGLALSRNAEILRVKAEDTLRALGFGDVESDYYQLSSKHHVKIEKPARTFAHKVISSGGKQYHVICALFKGTTTIPDAITDINSLVDGFYFAGKNCTDALKNYIAGISGATKDNTILFITGHSLGASTANVVGELCLDEGLVNESSEFVYAFASPNYWTNGRENDGKSHLNFRTFTNEHDLVPTVPPNFTRISKPKEHKFDYNALSAVQKKKFNRIYEYFRDRTFEEDTSLLGLGLVGPKQFKTYAALKNHLAHTYMSFILSELPDKQIDEHLAKLKASDLKVKSSLKLTKGKSSAIPATASVKMTFKSSAPAVAAISGSKVKGKKNGKATITVTAEGTAEFKTGEAKLKAIVKTANPVKVKGRTAKIKAGKKNKKLKKTRALKVKRVLAIKKAKGKVTFAKKSGSKKITISKKTGKVTVKKGLKKKTYKVKVTIMAAGNKSYWPKKVTRTFRIKVQ